MSLFDWFSSLFSSKSDEENKASENNIERDNDKSVEIAQNLYEKSETQNQVYGDLKVQDNHGIELEKAETEKLKNTEVDIQQQNKGESGEKI